MLEPFIGFIGAFGFSFAPRGWSFCKGQLISISQSSTLFSLVGIIYGGDGRTTYGLPDLRGRTGIGFGAGLGLSPYRIGDWPGQEYAFLKSTQLPAHTHAATVTPGTPTPGSSDLPPNAFLVVSTQNGEHDVPQSGDYLATSFKARGDLNKNYIPAPDAGNRVELGGLEAKCSGGALPYVAVGNTGASQYFSVMQPFLTINYSIAMMGVFPPRN